MDKIRKRCIILTPADLSPENINATVQTIEHNLNCFYLLETGWKTNLWEVVEQLESKIEDESLIVRVRIAYDLKFDLHTELRTDDDLTDGVAVKSLADLLELLDFDENLYLRRVDYHVIINDNDGADRAVTKLFQQMAFLSLDIDIRKKFAVAQEKPTRPIRVALMGGSIKVGKSTINLNLIKRDYAPTALTLPTPNMIKYISAPPDSKLKLGYKGEMYTFNIAKELNNFINDEFHATMSDIHANWNLPDMTIYYPCDNLNGYEVWDTPGPNFAFTYECAETAKSCIEAVDVCIFVMSYSNHLTNGEICALKAINKFLQAENKMSYVVFVVNQVDLRYNDCEEKSIPRLLDYIQTRLEIIGYENPVIFGTSALQGFYLDKVVELVKADRAKAGEDIDALPIVTEDSIRPLKRRHRNAIPQLSFVGRLLDDVIDFHGIENPTERELYALSGIPQLRRYVDYLGEQAQRRS